MPIPTFTEADLAVSQKWLNDVSTSLQNRGLATPIQTTLDECAGKVADYTARYELPDSRWKRLVRALALHGLHVLIGAVPEGVKAGYESAMRELEGIRDGKFPDLVAASDPVVEISPQAGAWGGSTKVSLR